MHRHLVRRLALLAFALSAILALALPGAASAHNTLLSSDPADGATLASAPTQIAWQFDNSVPLETMTVTLIDATGTRSELSGSTHGPAGDTQVITPLPALPAGEVSLRWRLVGPDGHPITGRVDFAITAATTTTPATEPPTSAPVGTSPVPTTAAASVDPADADTGLDDDGAHSTPSAVRWVLRYASYLAVIGVVGILLTTTYVWEGAARQPLLQQIMRAGLLAIAVLGFVQLLVVASDISGEPPWSSFGSIDAALTTNAGAALMVRVAIAIAMLIIVVQYSTVQPDVYWAAMSLAGLGLLATWAFAGHSSSMRWPTIGVLTDIAHHAAAAGWIAGLAIVAWIVLPRERPDVIVPVVRRFSRFAAICVGVLIVTGLAQSIRLVGSPTVLLDATHGRLLALKLVAFATMVVLANVNRQRLDARLDAETFVIGPLRRTMLTEFAIGLVIVALTAAMVVSPPGTS
jgi:copper transport protein